jgi:CheY-like chemotaxis protein
MGGDVQISRTEPGKGSCFQLVLPVLPAPGATMVNCLVPPKKDSARPQNHVKLHGRILLAEDGADNQRLIRFHLERAGAVVEIADNGRVAMEMIDRAVAAGSPYDLLITDMQMPVMDGYTLASTLRQRGSTLAIVALTAHAMAEDRARCAAAGCDDYATKPIDKQALLGCCAAWLGKAGGAGRSAKAA